MVVGGGPNAAVRRWGGLLARRYHKNNSEAKDFTTTHLGYDTDNGAFYYCEYAEVRCIPYMSEQESHPQ